MQTKCRRFDTKNDERRTWRYRAVPTKRGHQKALQICVFFWKVATPQKAGEERQNDSRPGWQKEEEWKKEALSRKYQLQHNYVWRTMSKSAECRARQRVYVVVGELCMTAMIDLWKEHTPKGLLKSFELLTHTHTHILAVKARKGKNAMQKNSKQCGKFFSYVIV